MGVADNATSGSSGMDFGYGVVGLSETGFRGGIGTYGSPGSLVRFNWDAGVAAVWDGSRFVTIGLADRLIDGYYSYDIDANTYGAFLTLDNNYNNAARAKIGLYINNSGNYGLKYGISIFNDGLAASKYGVNATIDNSAITDAVNGVVYRGTNSNTQGWGMLLASQGNTPTYIAGGGGIFSMADDFSVIGYASTATGTGVLGMGQSVPSIYSLANGSGVSGGGRDAGVYGLAINVADGTGGVFVGNNAGPMTLVNGSGVAGTGTYTGVYGNATSSSIAGNGSWGGYFVNGRGSFAYVGGSVTGAPWNIDYKINGSGSVSTIVDDMNNEPVNMFCPEAPEILFQDYGTGKLVNGKAYIKMDPIFTKNIYVDENNPIKVFVQLEGDCKGVYVTNKTADGFEVVELQGGTSNVPFSWTVTATRADRYDESGNIASKHVGIRFPRGPKAMETKKLETTESQTQEDSDEKYIIEDDKKREVEEIKFEKIK